jgi:penicillin-binding protein 1A
MKIKIFSTLAILVWVGTIVGIGAFCGYIYMVSKNTGDYFGPMPSLEILENPKSEEASELYTADNVLLGKYWRENRSPIEFEELSPNVVKALIATEDFRFEQHSGIDIRGMFRVFFKTIIMGQKSAGGGSTISQQLAKNLFNTRSSAYEGKFHNKNRNLGLVINKTKEWLTAIKIEKSYTKQEILTMYLNTVDFGSNSFGIKVASSTFFNTSPDSLNVSQAAMLVGLLKAPTYYSPVLNPDNAIHRRNVVLSQMNKYNYLEKAQYDSLSNQPLNIVYLVENQNQGLATYFRGVITNYLIYWAKKNGYDLYSDGLKIRTTLDSKLQLYAEQAVEEHMKYLQDQFFKHWEGRNPWIDEEGKEIQNFVWNAAKRSDRYKALKQELGKDSAAIYKVMNTPIKMRVFSWNGDKDTLLSPLDSIKYYKHFLHTGFMAMDPHNGHIKAWVGGINYKHFKYDHVKQGKRQPGSTFKPIVYAAVMDAGYKPCDEILDAPVTFAVPTNDEPNKTWTPQNSEGKYSGDIYTLRKAMANSVNSITAFMIKKVTPQSVVNMARNLGIQSKLDPVPALCLGVYDVSIYELIGAYSTFANHGVYTEPFYIERIEDKHGNVIQEFIPKTIEALDEETAYLMIHMLKGATEERGGTALGLHRFGLLGYGNEVGGKTGTTQNNSDGWFVGVTPSLVAGAWVGGDDRSIHFRTMHLGQGARMSMPIWAKFMQKAYEDPSTGIKRERFTVPKNFNIELNCKKYVQRRDQNTDNDTTKMHYQNDIPSDFFN